MKRLPNDSNVHKSTASVRRTDVISRLSYRRPLLWVGLVMATLLAFGHVFQQTALHAASPASVSAEETGQVVEGAASEAVDAEEEVHEGQEGEDVEQGPPSLCDRGRLLARPDVAGTQPSLSPLVIHVLENDGPVPPLGAGPPGPPGNDEGEYSFSIIEVGTPIHGHAELTEDGTAIIYTAQAPENGDNGNGEENNTENETASRTLVEPQTYTDRFTYTIQDTCEREATGKVIVVVFRDDMPSTPALIARSHSPGASVSWPLSLPISATLTIPDSAFGEPEEDVEEEGNNGEEESSAGSDLSAQGVKYFSLTELDEFTSIRGNGPGQGLRFAKAAFRLTQFLDDLQIEHPVFDEPLILEVVFDPALLDDNETEGNDENGEAEPRLYYWNEENQAWQQDGIVRQSYIPATGHATFAIYHLTEFALFGSVQAVAEESIFIPIMMGNE